MKVIFEPTFKIMSKKILTIIGTRPNYIKVTQLQKAFDAYGNYFDHKILHTGQHFDKNMKQIFIDQLGLTNIEFFLEVEHGTPGAQIGQIIYKTDAVLKEWKPDLVIVVGDVNSTLAGAIAANKSNIKLAHLEAGLRSFDRTMPEEYNRLATDQLADILFVTEQSGIDHLLNEGRKKEEIHFVGNTMIDTLVAFDSQFDEYDVLEKLGVEKGKYILMTLHRPSNVDTLDSLSKLTALVNNISKINSIVFPIHPRTTNNLKKFGLYEKLSENEKIILTEPLDYFRFQKLVKHCKLVVTDSGGIQEETTYRQIPCLTLRENTERPITVTLGTNELIPFDNELIESKIHAIENGTYKKGVIPPLWDGKSSVRIAEVLKRIL